MMKEFIEYANNLSDQYYHSICVKLEPLIREKLTYYNKKTGKSHPKEYYELDSFIRHMPIIGFNSGNYDINLTKDFGLINYLLGEKGIERLAGEGLIIDVDDEGEKIEDIAHRPIEFIAKKGNKYHAIQSQKLLWLDMSNYLAAGTSLDK